MFTVIQDIRLMNIPEVSSIMGKSMKSQRLLTDGIREKPILISLYLIISG